MIEMMFNIFSLFKKSNVKYHNISPEEAKSRLDHERNIMLLDVRTKEEYAEGHIPNSKLLPLSILEKEVLKKIPDKSSTLFVYCSSGSRSKSAARILIKLGYSDVHNLGGIVRWPYEITKR